jgi:membrane glycosyltransferase
VVGKVRYTGTSRERRSALKKGNFIEIRRVVLLGMVILRKILACLINVTKENLKGHSMYSIILYLLISLVF